MPWNTQVWLLPQSNQSKKWISRDEKIMNFLLGASFYKIESEMKGSGSVDAFIQSSRFVCVPPWFIYSFTIDVKPMCTFFHILLEMLSKVVGKASIRFRRSISRLVNYSFLLPLCLQGCIIESDSFASLCQSRSECSIWEWKAFMYVYIKIKSQAFSTWLRMVFS